MRGFFDDLGRFCLFAFLSSLMFGCTVNPTIASTCQRIEDRFRPSTHIGQFGVYLDGDTLRIELKVAFDWLNGDWDEVPGYKTGEYTWTDAEKNDFRDDFIEEVSDTWSGAFPIESTDGARRLEVEVTVVEKPLAEAHWLIQVFRYPREGPDRPASVCDPGTFHVPDGCEKHAGGEPWGTVQLASNHRWPEHVQPLELPAFEVLFEPGEATKPDLTSSPPAWLISVPQWQFRLTGFADETEVDSPNDRAQEHPSIELARQRTAAVKEALLDLACPKADGSSEDVTCREAAGSRLFIRNLGSFADAPGDSQSSVHVELFQTSPINTLTHEAGHMLGSGDEASGPGGEEGEPVVSAEYAALVHWFTGEVLTRIDDDSLMSRGDVVRPRHYVPFLDALEVITCSSEWHIVQSAPGATAEAARMSVPPGRGAGPTRPAQGRTDPGAVELVPVCEIRSAGR